MPDNRTSASISHADQQTVFSAGNTLREKLPAYRALRTMGVTVFVLSVLLVAGGSKLSVGSATLSPAAQGVYPEAYTDSIGYSAAAGTTDYTHRINGSVSLKDFRKWCDPAKNPDATLYRIRCTQTASVALPFARVYALDATSNAELGKALTNKDGVFEITWKTTKRYEPRTVRIETDFAGFPRDSSYASFQVYSNPDVQGPPDMKDVSARKPIRAATASFTCKSRSCAPGTLSLMNDSSSILQNVSAVYLSLNYVYTDALYVADYHDYCMGLAKAGSSCPYEAKHLVVNVSDAKTSTGNETGFIQLSSGQAQGSDILHEFGHSLQFLSRKFTPATGGPYTPTEAWANFVRLAYEYSQDAPVVKDYVEASPIDTESQEPLCDNDGDPKTVPVPYSEGKSSPFCKTEETTPNWRMALWDLYDKKQEATRYPCEAAATFGSNGDGVVLSFSRMLEAWRNSLQYGTANHGVAEAASGDNKSTNNLYDYVYNLSVVSGVPIGQVEQTGINHACQRAQPTD
ncbi:MAG TPA: hypothetical protein VEX60_10495 [Pyrinomonadaceae bacterium]|nr:hypothetical protein [Pyrinomonadaceae bacterium]